MPKKVHMDDGERSLWPSNQASDPYDSPSLSLFEQPTGLPQRLFLKRLREKNTHTDAPVDVPTAASQVMVNAVPFRSSLLDTIMGNSSSVCWYSNTRLDSTNNPTPWRFGFYEIGTKNRVGAMACELPCNTTQSWNNKVCVPRYKKKTLENSPVARCSVIGTQRIPFVCSTINAHASLVTNWAAMTRSPSFSPVHAHVQVTEWIVVSLLNTRAVLQTNYRVLLLPIRTTNDSFALIHEITGTSEKA